MANTGVVYVRQIDGEAVEMGVSGRLWRDALVMYDRTTKSFWSQVDGRAIVGPAVGRQLEELPSVVTTWGRWKAEWPSTFALMPGRLAPFGSRYERYHRSPDQLGVLGSENPDPRLPGKELVLGLIHDHFAAAVPLSLVRERRMIQGDLGPHPIVVAAYAGSHAFVYLRRSGDRRLDFEPTGDGRLRDLQSGSVWDPATGRALAGPLQGESLPRIRSRRAYWFVWAAFHPGSTLLNGESGSLHRPA